MELDLNITTLNILAWSKLIFFIYGILLIYFIFKVRKVWLYMALTTIAVVVFYLVLSKPLQRMWWGNVGDELFVVGFLGKVLLDGPGHDFYYGWLPNFYPPLYFWVTGLVSRLIASNAIGAAKIGIAGTLLSLFAGTYFWQRLFWHKVNRQSINKKDIIASVWFWWLLPVLYLAMLNFDAIMLKPYEVLAALASVVLVGLTARSFYLKQWTWQLYIFLGISGGILFLTFYFWWLILIPALLFLNLQTGVDKLLNLKRLIYTGFIMALVSSVFWGPLFYSYIKYGIENGQATHFVPYDFYTFVPWQSFSWPATLYLIGLLGLIFFRKKSFIKASLVIWVACHLYQLFNIIIFLLGNRPIQASKPLLFLGTATVAVGLTYLVIYIYQQHISQLKPYWQKTILIGASLLLLIRMPFVYFIDDPVILRQIEIDLVRPQATIQLAEVIKTQVPDYKERIWLSSGSMELNAYLPLSYYIAHNQHFSHHASLYSQRMAKIEAMSQAKTPEEFMAIINQTEPTIDSLLLYYNPKTDNQEFYTLFFWHDNFPNGGKDVQVYLPQALIIESDWQKVYNENNWLIFIKK